MRFISLSTLNWNCFETRPVLEAKLEATRTKRDTGRIRANGHMVQRFEFELLSRIDSILRAS